MKLKQTFVVFKPTQLIAPTKKHLKTDQCVADDYIDVL